MSRSECALGLGVALIIAVGVAVYFVVPLVNVVLESDYADRLYSRVEMVGEHTVVVRYSVAVHGEDLTVQVRNGSAQTTPEYCLETFALSGSELVVVLRCSSVLTVDLDVQVFKSVGRALSHSVGTCSLRDTLEVGEQLATAVSKPTVHSCTSTNEILHFSIAVIVLSTVTALTAGKTLALCRKDFEE